MKNLSLLSCLSIAFAAQANAQIAAVPTPIAASAPTLVPALVPYAGVALAADGKPLVGDASATFLLFKDEKGGEPLWIESQSIAVDATGHYQVKLGASSSNGLPIETFASGQLRWLEVQIAGQPTAPRVLLTSVPYALKAADAATLGGLPASAFVLASQAGTGPGGNNAITPDAASNVTTTGGTSLYLPKFNAASTVIDSEIYDTGTSVGIGVVPNAGVKLDVGGAMIMRGNMTVSRTGNATASQAYPSYGFDFFSNLYNSSTKAGDNPYFQLQSEPTGNNTASPSATFNLLFANNGSAAAETGFYINPNGTIHFASGQTFPGTGTITGITTTSPLTGGGTSGSVALGLNTSALETTLNGAYAQLGASNTFSQNQFMGAGLYITGLASAGSLFSNSVNASPAGVTSYPVHYPLQAYSPNASAAEMGMMSAGTDAAIAVNNTATGGREYWIDSGSGSAGIGAGNFAIYDRTANAARMTITPSGSVGIGVISAIAQLEVQASPAAFVDSSILAQGTYYGPAIVGGPTGVGSDGIIVYGADTDGSSGAEAGTGGFFIGGNADNSSDAGYGLYAIGGAGAIGFTYSAKFQDDIEVDGNTLSDASSMKIDHPSDPANKYLVHASVQSSEMMNMYTGNVTTDSAGHATIALPAWFEAENADFRYQLTVVGQFAQAIVKDKIANGQFTIMTSAPSVEVSWLVTAVRQDAFAKAHPLVVEVAKPAREVGFYRHPELYGQPATRQTEWGRHPRMMQRMEAERAATQSRTPAAASTAARTQADAPPTRLQSTLNPLAVK